MRQEQLLNLGIAFVLLIAYGLYLLFMLKTHPESFPAAGRQEEHHGEGEQWGVPSAVGSLLGASVLAAWMSEILVGAAEGTGKSLGMSQTFIGIVLLAIVGGAAESGSAIAMARKNKWISRWASRSAAAFRSRCLSPLFSCSLSYAWRRSRWSFPSAGRSLVRCSSPF